MIDDKKKALEAAISQIEKTYGKGSIIKMDAENFAEGIGHFNGFTIKHLYHTKKSKDEHNE